MALALRRTIQRAMALDLRASRESSRRLFWLALLAVVALGVAQASLRLGDSLNVDEPFTANMVRLSLPEMWAAFAWDNAALPHYLLLKAWSAIFGESEVALRGLSVLFFAATILVVGLTARRAAGFQAGVVAALLVATSSNLGLVHAAQARQYALVLLEAALAGALCFALIRRQRDQADVGGVPTAALWALLLLVCVLGLLTHLIFVFVMAGMALGATAVSRRFFLNMVGLCAAASLIYLALWWPVLRQTLPLPITSWMRPPQPIDFYYGLRTLWGWKRGLLLVAYLLIVLALGFRRLPGLLSQPSLRFGLIFLATTLLVPYVVSQVRPVYNPDRTPVIFLPMISVIAGVLIGQLGLRLLTLGFVAAIALGSAQFSLKAAAGPDPIPAREALRQVAASARCGDTLVLGGLSFSEAEYYLRRFGAPSCIDRITFPLDTRNHPGWIDAAGLASQKEQLAREAQEIANRLAQQPEGRVWLFSGRGYGQELTPLIERELDRLLTRRETLDLRGSFFESVEVYQVAGK